MQTHMMVDWLLGSGCEVRRVDTIVHRLNKPALAPLRILLQPFVTAVHFLRQAPKCDIVHLQVCSWWGFLPALTCAPINKLITHKRLVISFHGGQGHDWIQRYSWLAIPILKMADALLVVSPHLKQAFADHGITSEMLPNLVDLKRFRFRERPKIKPNIVWIRQFMDVYDPLTALKVFEKVKSDVPEATITFIGDGPLRPMLDAFIMDHGIRDVRFTGHLDNKLVPTEFDKADIFLNTSTDDAQPTALLEASASGLPIVTTGVGGIPNMIDSGTEGIVVPAGDVDALYREVIGLIQNPSRAHSIGLAARQNAEKYGWKKCAEGLVKAYGLGE